MKLIKLVIVTFLSLVLGSEISLADVSNQVGTTASIEFLNDGTISPPIPPIVLPPGEGEGTLGEQEKPNGEENTLVPNCPETLSKETSSEKNKQTKWRQDEPRLKQDSWQHLDDSNVKEHGYLPQTGEKSNELLIILGTVLIAVSGYLYKNKKKTQRESY
ncbi:LPXTG cell wall anchor domain-containing protein [Vagococcus intermedius]|uniref:LPXTG cell wall anchor domain-containing protein n=1 Tax=Vagococcus intermedius TaxID=2991418 RepID=A0AAF0CVT1_9ENTE|nr:LPXTG cell wall anchor domain-containing protein [Vagococcus intermedius]WEG73612.1 LPXTG cell wall anchor domain-containing protein [Vagococcus intermedius]WEG75696.1 LPXTG cell wall anchor domain-containing protein [Vagococcus intermedius]